MKLIEEEDVKYYIGRNAKDNTDLFNIMPENSLWFHLEGEPGCHVYIVTEIPIEKEHIVQAAQYTKIYSKVHKKSSICYLEKKYLKKGKALGEVILKKEPKIIRL